MHYARNYLKIKEYKAVSAGTNPAGKRRLAVYFVPRERSFKPDYFIGDVNLFIDGVQFGEGKGIKLAGQNSAVTGYRLLIERHTGTAVSDDSDQPFAFNGKIKHVNVEIK